MQRTRENITMFLKKNINLIFLIIILIHFVSPAYADTIDLKDKFLWNKTVKFYLKYPLWTDMYAYDAGHFLMVPLHAAFLNNQEVWQIQFAQHFQRFVKAYLKYVTRNRLSRLQYLYLASRFLVLAAEKKKQGLIPSQLHSILYTEIKNFWQKDPAWQWNRTPFLGGIRERVLWKLNHKNVKKSYYRAIIDETLFVFAIAADLYTYERLSGVKNSSILTDILNVAYRVFQQEVVYQPDGGWLFQPGVWTDHPDYAYAGHKKKIPSMKPLPIPGIAWDSSHSHRFPLWLTSLAGAYPPRSKEYIFYNNLKKGLEKQFFGKVLVPPTKDFAGYRMRNFMDGRNGIYRWKYITLGKNNGYGPYELSRTLLLGWWVFLGTSRIFKVYKDIANSYPLPSLEIVYVLFLNPNYEYVGFI